MPRGRSSTPEHCRKPYSRTARRGRRTRKTLWEDLSGRSSNPKFPKSSIPQFKNDLRCPPSSSVSSVRRVFDTSLLCNPTHDRLLTAAPWTAVRTLCKFSRRTASGPEGSSAKSILCCAAGPPGRGRRRCDPSHVPHRSRPQMASAAVRRRHRPARRVETLKNAIATGRLAQSFIFAGPRGVGKTTTARILARALNCVKGPTPEPCGKCDACREIAEGRDVDVLEIDGATYTGVDAVREVIVEPLVDRADARSLQDLHHRRSPSAVEERVRRAAEVDRRAAAVREVHDGDDRAALGAGDDPVAVAGLRAEDAAVRGDPRSARRPSRRSEKVTIDDAALALVARSAEGSMRDALSALDQVLAFTSDTVTATDVSTVLGLIGRDAAVRDRRDRRARGRRPPSFALAGTVVEAGFDLRIVCRELARLMRDLMVVKIDPSRFTDPEIAAESERDRLKALAARYSREDLMRAFDLLSQSRVRDPQLVAAAPSVRDGAGEVDPSAEAHAAQRDLIAALDSGSPALERASAAAPCAAPAPAARRRRAAHGRAERQRAAAPRRSASAAGPAHLGNAERRQHPRTRRPRNPEHRRSEITRSCRPSASRTRCSTAWSIAQAQKIEVEGDADRVHVRAGAQALAAVAARRQARAGSSSSRSRRPAARCRSSRAKARPRRRRPQADGSGSAQQGATPRPREGRAGRAGRARRLRRRDRGRGRDQVNEESGTEN